MSGSASAAELVVVDLIAQHDVEPDEEAPSQRHLRFGPAATPEDSEVDALETGIASGRERSRLAEHPAQERAALLADVPQPTFVRGRVDGRRQPDVADHVLAAGESPHGTEHQHGREGTRNGPGCLVGASHARRRPSRFPWPPLDPGRAGAQDHSGARGDPARPAPLPSQQRTSGSRSRRCQVSVRRGGRLREMAGANGGGVCPAYARLLGENMARLESLVHQVQNDVDTGRLDRASALQDQTSALEAQHRIVDKIPTWPWQPETIRIIITAVFVPVLLIVIQIIIQRFLTP